MNLINFVVLMIVLVSMVSSAKLWGDEICTTQPWGGGIIVKTCTIPCKKNCEGKDVIICETTFTKCVDDNPINCGNSSEPECG